MDNDFFKKLKVLENNGQIVSIFTDKNNANTWSSGFIEAISEEHIVLKHISPEGRYDGFIARRLNSNYRLDFDGIYEQRLLKLYKIQKQSHGPFIIDKEQIGVNLFKEVLQSAKSTNYVVTICIDEDVEQEDIIGFVKEINDKTILISKISYEGIYDGESIFYLKDIISINCNTSDEIIYKLLYKVE